jgi:nucleoside phosphorylase/CheY-like chemotaxis protein
MKILIVDDLPKKIKALVDTLNECRVNREDILIAQCAIEAKRILMHTHVELMIVDIMLPQRPEDTPTVQTSLELLTELLEDETYKTPAHILGVTAYLEAMAEAQPLFQEQTWGLLQFDESTTDWAIPVCNAVEFIRRRAEQPIVAHYDVDICVLTALSDPEMKAVYRLPWEWQPPTPLDDSIFVRKGSLLIEGVRYSVVAACAPRMGMVASALTASKLIESFRPRILAMVGICAGIKSKTNLGDVIFADATWDWQSGKKVAIEKKDGGHNAGRLEIAPHQLPVPEFLRSRVRNFADDSDVWNAIREGWPSPPASRLKLIIGPLASGSVVLADSQTISEIQTQHRSLVGIEMEAYGVLAAASSSSKPRPIPVVFKAVCDFADSEKNDAMQTYASYTSAQALHEFLIRNLVELRELAGS